MREHKFGFTLAEVMIVLTVIGILSAILLPVAFQTTPDKNVLRFKKAYNDFSRIIRDLASSGEYYLPGDLGKYPDGTKIDGSSDEHYKYFCKTVADSVATKSVDCETIYGDESWGDDSVEYDATVYPAANTTYIGANLDWLCFRTQNASAGYIRTVDDIYIINHSPETVFYSAYNVSYMGDENIKKYFYKYICIDIDEPQKGVKPFAIGFRPDGKMKLGERAKWWLTRDINKKETDCCALSNVNATNAGDFFVNLCDDSDTICP